MLRIQGRRMTLPRPGRFPSRRRSKRRCGKLRGRSSLEDEDPGSCLPCGCTSPLGRPAAEVLLRGSNGRSSPCLWVCEVWVRHGSHQVDRADGRPVPLSTVTVHDIFRPGTMWEEMGLGPAGSSFPCTRLYCTTGALLPRVCAGEDVQYYF